jgi:phosphoribosylaminoimidazolecarboxamide formyltransferase/IMP cyclohydrolase
VSDKTGLIDLAAALHARGVELIATGKTAESLKSHHLPVTEVSQLTGFPEILDGRVKTLHPAIHAGILARSGLDDETLKAHHFAPIDWVIVNLYPFGQNPCIENIDIGGPTLIRAAAKNFDRVAAVVDPADYSDIITLIDEPNSAQAKIRRRQLAHKAFIHTAAYDRLIAQYFGEFNSQDQWELKTALRYGENPHQKAAWYIEHPIQTGSLADSVLIQGKALSYNNLLDADTALQMVQSYANQAYCCIVKHATPCAAALDKTLSMAYQTAFQADSESAFGGIVALGQVPSPELLTKILAQQFIEVLLVPQSDQEHEINMLQELGRKKPNLRILCYHPKPVNKSAAENRFTSIRSIFGGHLVQDAYIHHQDSSAWRVVSRRPPSEQEWLDLSFAWHVAKFAKSNAIVITKDQATLGIGAGQTSRIFALRNAVLRADMAGLMLQGAALASDAFFPFPDSIELASDYGIRAIIQPGGAKQDASVIARADASDMALVFTDQREFRH